ncbi:MAG: fibronectin type III domain-containing protein [Thaumarchaeota archaeon]|nr:fibronectin type III domain-containing protein [Nitrososphaerota archaeon]MDE1839754.1 fibronectin type III domain-containing protein [Nitrososphaerota archaeon]
MSKHGLYLAVLLSVSTISIILIPVYAEVTSLKTNALFYKGGSTIYFSGTILNTDPPNVTILVFDPTGKFILLASGNADNNHQFQIAVDTSTSTNQQKFLLKGTYNATAFIANKENGQTVNFVFSPDGSPMIPSPPTSLTASVISSTEIDLSWTAPSNPGGTQSLGYEIGRSTDGGSTWSTSVIPISSTTFTDVGLTPNTSYMYRVYAVNQAGTSIPSNVTSAVTLQTPGQTATQGTMNTTTNQSSTPLAELLQQRLADAQRLQELLHGGNSGSTNPSGSVQVIHLNETMAVNDASSSLGVQKPANVSGNNSSQSSINFDIHLVVYPVISLVGVGIVVYVLYLRRKRKPLGGAVVEKKDIVVPPDVTSDQKDGDYAMMIIKNRLAKGEITVDEFKALKDELSEP